MTLENNTTGSLLKEGTAILKEAGIPEASLDAWLLLEFVTGITRAHFFAYPEEILAEEQVHTYRSLIAQRAERIPLQHLTHQAFFMGYEFYVDERVLVPRQDTETLVEEALQVLKGVSNPAALDMCTGSGCIVISLLKERKDLHGVGVDLSRDALTVAQKNAKDLGVADRLALIESDLFSAPFFEKNSSTEEPLYDILISNPPYIPTADIDGLMDEVRLHDPKMALDGREDGLWFYREITRHAGAYLKEGGWLLYEIGCSQGPEVAELMRQEGFLDVTVRQDLSGLDRVVAGRKAMTGGKHV